MSKAIVLAAGAPRKVRVGGSGDRRPPVALVMTGNRSPQFEAELVRFLFSGSPLAHLSTGFLPARAHACTVVPSTGSTVP